eukprot:1153379-Pelagomonas_calceolata.AAC.8
MHEPGQDTCSMASLHQKKGKMPEITRWTLAEEPLVHETRIYVKGVSVRHLKIGVSETRPKIFLAVNMQINLGSSGHNAWFFSHNACIGVPAHALHLDGPVTETYKDQEEV